MSICNVSTKSNSLSLAVVIQLKMKGSTHSDNGILSWKVLSTWQILLYIPSPKEISKIALTIQVALETCSDELSFILHGHLPWIESSSAEPFSLSFSHVNVAFCSTLFSIWVFFLSVALKQKHCQPFSRVVQMFMDNRGLRSRSGGFDKIIHSYV